MNYVYLDGNPDGSQPATGKRPDGTVLNGASSYETLLSYFTTTLIKPDKLREKAWNRLQEVYKEVRHS